MHCAFQDYEIKSTYVKDKENSLSMESEGRTDQM